MNKTEYKLLEPIENGPVVIEALSFPEKVTAGHLKGCNLDNFEDMENMLKLISNLTGESPKTVDKIGLPDFFQLAEILGNLLGNLKFQKTSPN